MRSKRRIRRFGVVALLVLALAMLASACGGTESGSGDGHGRETGANAALAWAECMRKNGVDVPDPTVDASGRLVITPGSESPNPRQPGFRRAMEACDDHMRKALPNPSDMSKEEQARMRDAALEFAKCMRARGIDMPDPSTSGGGVAIPVDPNDPAFRRAAEACEDKLPLPGGGS